MARLLKLLLAATVTFGVLATLEGQPTTTISRFPRFTTVGRPTCNFTRVGHPYFDLTTSSAYVCDGTSYLLISSGGGVAGNVFTAAITADGAAGNVNLGNDGGVSGVVFEGDLADAVEGVIDYSDIGNGEFSIIPNYGASPIYRFNGPPAAGASGNLFRAEGIVLAAMNGSDTVNIIDASLTNANHTGVSNALNFFNIPAITADADATETAIKVGSGWDVGIDAATALTISVDSTIVAQLFDPVTSFGGALSQVTNNIVGVGAGVLLTAMDSSGDITTLLEVNFLNADHTAGTLNGINFAAFSSDAQAQENAINVGGGWDAVLTTSADNIPVIYSTNAGGNILIRSDSANPQWKFLQSGSQVFTILKGSTGGAGITLSFLQGTDLAVVGSAQTITPNSLVVEIGAGAAASVSVINPPTGAASTHSALLTLVCKDANVTFNDADRGGAADTIDLAGAATNFVCTDGDTLTLALIRTPGTGNERWSEVARSVN